MYKIKATKREMRDNHYVISASYCEMQSLLNNESPVAYSAGIYGWSCDYYLIDDVIICTGYSTIKSKNTYVSYKDIQKVEAKARKVLDTRDIDYKNEKKKIQRLLHNFIKKSKIQK